MKQDHSIDQRLVKKVLEGNSNAFKTIILNTQGLVIQIIYKMVRSSEDREDLAQEVYLKVFNNLAGFKFNSKLSTWIGTITYNTCLNFLEKKKIPILNVIDKEGNESWDIIDSTIIDNASNQTESYIFKKESSQVLAQEIEKLPPLYKTIITLYHNEELSYKEIGKITNLPEGTLKSYLYRARKQLKENLLLNYKREDL
ncbi:RNA polymerase sigma factor [Aquimarina sp. 2201CG5-10]|uniref:RNA polymerase sigma factor n=1 Tax=Aquimarina callyspongiae TaxID=3098150 RepID=UPI002AB4B57F|nr:sigma-70 family RNA polymerase sigma factor [Aquimarina sp. 2201CG5-10]MDY8137059.1 sigma-70 family RNA polymerase sigma factor [Aquimarina sp. 2201CG5-10]